MPPYRSPQDVVKEIFSEMSLIRKGKLAGLTEDSADALQRIFDWYIGAKTGLTPGDKEYSKIMKELWKRLRETHQLKVLR